MRRSLLALALAGALLSACGDDRATSSASTDPATTAAAAPATGGTDGAAAVPDALDFSAPLVGGEQLDFRGYAGETVALWFWAPT
jgi:hypothetical protein